MKIFYGWWVLVGAFLVYTANNGILMYTLPLFYPQWLAEFGWNEEQVTRPASLFFLVAALLTPVMGVLFDRYSTRRIMLFGVVAILAALICLPGISSLNQLLVIYMVFALGLAGCGLVPNMLILTRWFKRRRGLAVGLLLLGSSFGGVFFPLLTRTSITPGWREAVWFITLVGAAMMLIGVLALLRNHPQALGLGPDGDAIPTPDSPSMTATNPGPAKAGGEKPALQSMRGAAPGPTLGQAMRTPVFYILVFVTAAMWFCIVGLIQHQSIFLKQDLGVDAGSLPLVFSLFFWFAIIGKLVFGYLSDHYDKVKIMFVAILCLIVGLLLLRILEADNRLLLYAYATIFGAGFGGSFSMIQLVLAEYFSGASYGKILALLTMVDSIAGALGIRYLGMARVEQQSYLPAFGLLIILCSVAAFLVMALMRFKRAPQAI